MEPLPRLPGVFFETVQPRPAPGLPRMDVAAFVGLAAAGPIDAPVPVEDVRRFRDLFGPDPLLAFDGESGRPSRGRLGAAVEAFFANGGKRCWVVRVADAEAAARHVFALPGLVAAEDRESSPEILAEALARCPGSWCEELAAGTALYREPLRLVRSEDRGDGDDEPALELATASYRLDLAADAAALTAGDLLELSFGPGTPELLLFVDSVTPHPGGARVTGGRVDPGSGDTVGAWWQQARAAGSPVSPPAAGEPAAEGEPPLPVAEADGLAFAAAALGSPPGAAGLPAVRRLTFELSVWRGSELVARLDRLAFDRRHPRFWGALPDDEALFAWRPGRPPGEPEGLAADAADPRFPLAGPAAPAAFYLPWGMRTRRDAAAARGLDGPHPGTPLERDGLAVFGPELFVDLALAPYSAGAVLGEAEHRYYLRGLALGGLHSLLPVGEPSLVAVPDAVHRGWSRELGGEPRQPPLAAPELAPVGAPDAGGRLHLAWSAVPEATGYLLVRDADPTFGSALTVYEGDATGAVVALPPGCPQRQWFRVRAVRHGELGPWSNSRARRLPPEPFAACAGDRPGAVRLLSASTGSPPAVELTWAPEAPAEPPPPPEPAPAAGYELQSAADTSFVTADTHTLSATSLTLDSPRTEGLFYRVRATAGLPGPWSNTVFVPAEQRGDWAQPAPAAAEDATLLAVHRALVRFAAARCDMLALLALPAHYRTDDARRHVARLAPETGGAGAAGRVPPLTLGEAPALGYAALLHPWVTARGESATADAELRTVPPDGPVAGVLAAVAAGDGAWRAPANRPLAGAVALAPAVGRDWPRLAAAGVNAVVHDPRGFLLLSEDTLARTAAARPIHVRRLLILLRRLALAEGERFVFENPDADFRERVRHHFETVLAGLYRRGAFAGATPAAAYRVVTDGSVNPPASLDRGRFVVELRVAPARALAFLTVRLVAAGRGRLEIEEV